jgi:hypothetical protein
MRIRLAIYPLEQASHEMKYKTINVKTCKSARLIGECGKYFFGFLIPLQPKFAYERFFQKSKDGNAQLLSAITSRFAHLPAMIIDRNIFR